MVESCPTHAFTVHRGSRMLDRHLRALATAVPTWEPER